MVDRTRCASIILVLLGLGLVSCGVLLFVLGGKLIKSGVDQASVLKPNTTSYINWRNPPVPLHISFYVFNITNVPALNHLTVPSVQQIGPFVYKEVRTKIEVEEYENGTLSYREPRTYEFLQSLSVGDPTTIMITTMNLVYMTLVNLLQKEHVDNAARELIGDFLSFKEKPTMQHTVHELLWNYKDPLLAMVKRDLPFFLDSDEVSIYNASASLAGLNTFLINDGVNLHGENAERIKQVGNIEGFNGRSTLSYWSNEYANKINGTDSTLWHPDTQTNDEVYIFSSDLCRSLRLEFREKYTNKFNIENFHFELPSSTFNNEAKQDFCLNTTKSNKAYGIQCLPNGLMSLTTCVKLGTGSVSLPLPIIASSPHFLDAAPSVQNGVQGLQPNEDIHRSFMDVEPLTGTVMNGSRRMQINLNVVNDSSIEPIAQYLPCVFPMIWLEEHAEIDQPRADEFHAAVTTRITILTAVKYLALSLGGVLFVITIILIVRRYHKTKTTGMAFAPPLDETSPLCS